MDKFLEKYNFSKLNQEEIENLNTQAKLSSLPLGSGIFIIHDMHSSSATTSAWNEVSAEVFREPLGLGLHLTFTAVMMSARASVGLVLHALECLQEEMTSSSP